MIKHSRPHLVCLMVHAWLTLGECMWGEEKGQYPSDPYRQLTCTSKQEVPLALTQQA